MAYDKVVDSTQLDGAITATADAIRGKTGASASIPWDMSAGFSAAIAAIPTGGGAAEPERDVNFIDYDGTIVHSYTAAEFAELTALPDNPSHDGLTAQGWNWSLADAQEYVADYGKLWVGQMYVTDDGKTRIYIKLEEGRLAPYLGIAVNGSVDVDWGDGSAQDVITGSSTTTTVNTQHTYAAAGEYTIALTVTGKMALVGDTLLGSKILWAQSNSSLYNRVYQNAVTRMEIGTNCIIRSVAFGYCFGLDSITIPSSVTDIASRAFVYCGAIRSITVPSDVTNLIDYGIQYCHSLKSIAIPSAITRIGNGALQSNQALASVSLPSGITNLGSGALQSDVSLSSITIPRGVTTIGNTCFYGCYGLGSVRFSSNIPPTISSSNTFQDLPSDCVIYVPRGSLEAYTTATNYPSSNTYTYVEYDP